MATALSSRMTMGEHRRFRLCCAAIIEERGIDESKIKTSLTKIDRRIL